MINLLKKHSKIYLNLSKEDIEYFDNPNLCQICFNREVDFKSDDIKLRDTVKNICKQCIKTITNQINAQNQGYKMNQEEI